MFSVSATMSVSYTHLDVYKRQEQDRADKKRYPAVNPIDSYSKYIEYPEFEEYIKGHINDEWIGKVNELKTRLQRGKEIAEQINIDVYKRQQLTLMLESVGIKQD